MSTEKKLTGKLPREAIRMLGIPRLAPEIVTGFTRLVDLTGTVSDAMDNLGLSGAIPASVLAPSLPGKRIVGQALTVRNVERQQSVFRSAAEGRNLMAETEAYNLSEPGDVIVIEGLVGMSNMGGQSVMMAHLKGCAGAVVDGSYRDPEATQEFGFPIWTRGITQITGKWRLETVEINGRVHIAGVSVDAGDLVVADAAGVVIIPREHVAAVLEQSRKIDAGDARRKQDIAAGVDMAVILKTKYK